MVVDPASLYIVTYPHPSLREPARPLESVTDEVRSVAARMVDLMHEAAGIGLAAPQVGLPWRMFVAHVPPLPDEPRPGEHPAATREPTAYINPSIVSSTGGSVLYEEGCLSLPGVSGDVPRPPTVTIRATMLDGSEVSLAATGLLARCWQHEIDHLDGVLILDRMTQMARRKNRSAVKSLEGGGRGGRQRAKG